jgi:acetyl-CoA C-acetyltransferase/acetyl-CoA acyltransferase
MSNIPLLWDRRMAGLLLELRRQRRWWGKLKVLARLRPQHFKPVAAIELGLTDPVSGLIMGKTAEVLAKEFAILRDEQDRFALRSHERALAARERCFLSGEIEPIQPRDDALTLPSPSGRGVGVRESTAPLDHDTGPRAGQTLEALARLKPFFEPNTGTVTVGNACPVTDGAAAVVAMTPERARALGHEPLGFVRAYAYAGCDPRRMGLGPVFATARLLRDTGLTLADFDLVELNEAFAVQVLSCLRAFASDAFARDELGQARALGEVDPERLNVNGGAVALGHPVGATGTRLVITLLRALRAAGLRRGLATLCVGGGQGAALLVETELD